MLPGGIRSGARDFWDVILPALAGHSAMRNLYLDYGIPAGSVQAEICFFDLIGHFLIDALEKCMISFICNICVVESGHVITLKQGFHSLKIHSAHMLQE